MATAVELTQYPAPGHPDSPVELEERYDHFIGGAWVAPTTGEYRQNLTPATGQPFCETASSAPADVELALDAAHAAKTAWARRSPTERAAVLDAVADAIDANREMLAVAESYENGKPVRETRSEEHTSELQSRRDLVCRLLLNATAPPAPSTLSYTTLFRSSSAPADVELALDAAHAAKTAWARRSPTERAAVLDAVADAIDANREMLAVAESYENGKPVRET